MMQEEFPLDSLHQQARNGQNLDQGSPESWASGSNQGGILPQADPSLSDKDLLNIILGDLVANDLALDSPLTAPKEKRTDSADTADKAVVTRPKGKVHTVFSEGQLKMLFQSFSVQKYLSPIEMKNLAKVTELTYKQVKTWFQNHRMNLRRRQKDTSWVAGPYAIHNNKEQLNGPMFNMPSHIPPGGMVPQLQLHNNQHMMTEPPQNPALYMGSLSGPSGSAGSSSWPTGSVQSAVHNTPQVSSWPMAPEVDPYSLLGALNPPGVPLLNYIGNNIGFQSRDVSNSFYPAMMYNPSL